MLETRLPDHPGIRLRQMLESGDVTLDQLLRCGVQTQFTTEFCRRFRDLTSSEDNAVTQALARATGVPASRWVEWQKAWNERRQREHGAANRRGF